MNVLDEPCFLRRNTVTAVYEPVEEEGVEMVSFLGTQEFDIVSSPDQESPETSTVLGQETSVPFSSLDGSQFEMASSLETTESKTITSHVSEKTLATDSCSILNS